MAPRGYAWWYLDALSDDRSHGITLIAFVGSVFSPYYAWARRGGGGDPTRHVALNVALYGPRQRWSMTERGPAALRRDANHIAIGPSSLSWEGDVLTIEIDEIAVPFPRRLRGTVKLHPASVETTAHILDRAGRHRWRPIAPCARVDVAFDAPALKWSGPGYLDTNDGDAPLEQDFQCWNWSRAHLPDGAVVLYEALRRDGTTGAVALHYSETGGCSPIELPLPAPLPRTMWGVSRATRADGGQAILAKTLEDTPFYSRSLLNTRLLGHEATAMHESLDLDRFRMPIVQAMLPFRMPRRP